MAENKHNAWDLAQMQSLPLNAKIQMTKRRIIDWYEYWDGQVYVSFSGGKDSTVLADLVRNVCGLKDVPMVFVDTGLEYPEIREFVKTFDNVVWLKPEMQFKKVIEKYGYPFISKQTSRYIQGARRWLREHPNQDESNAIVDLKIMRGKLEHKCNGVLTGEYSKEYNKKKYEFMLDAPFEVSNKCCQVMKKNPMHKYVKETGRKPITGQTAEESHLRTIVWMKNGCNAFDTKDPISNPMSFWTEQDILLYIKKFKIKICSVYGDVVYTDDDGMEYTESLFMESMKLSTTGCTRTGCMFCGYGCHLDKGVGRFERMKVTHPKQYEWIMKPWSAGGLGYREVIDWLNEHGNLNIKY